MYSIWDSHSCRHGSCHLLVYRSMYSVYDVSEEHILTTRRYIPEDGNFYFDVIRAFIHSMHLKVIHICMNVSVCPVYCFMSNRFCRLAVYSWLTLQCRLWGFHCDGSEEFALLGLKKHLVYSKSTKIFGKFRLHHHGWKVNQARHQPEASMKERFFMLVSCLS
jgi:hypothetical protein